MQYFPDRRIRTCAQIYAPSRHASLCHWTECLIEIAVDRTRGDDWAISTETFGARDIGNPVTKYDNRDVMGGQRVMVDESHSIAHLVRPPGIAASRPLKHLFDV
jgi:hypothetical protein